MIIGHPPPKFTLLSKSADNDTIGGCSEMVAMKLCWLAVVAGPNEITAVDASHIDWSCMVWKNWLD